MNELLGLIDSLEATILESTKIPMTDKLVIEEKTLLALIDKIRLVIKSNGSVARQAIDTNNKETTPISDATNTSSQTPAEYLHLEKEKISKMKEGANEYADYVMANLELMVSKLQKNLIRLEKNIESGREIITEEKNKLVEKEEENETR